MMRITADEGILSIEIESMQEENYEIKMMKNNTFAHFLEADSVMIDNVRKVEYKIAGMISFRTFLEKNNLTRKNIELFVDCLGEAIREVTRFMIDYHRICVSVDTVFIKDDRFYFCIVPGFSDYDDNLKSLLEYMLEHVDYKDNKAVIWMYQFYQNVIRDKISILEIKFDGTKEEMPQPEPVSVPVVIESVEPKKSKVEFRLRAMTVGAIALFLIFVAAIIFKGLLPVGRKVSMALVILFGGISIYLIWEDWKSYKEPEEVAEVKKDDNDGATMLLVREPPCLVYGLDEEQKVPINVIPFILGSGKEMVDHRIKNRSVSRLHARIFCEGDRYFIEDLGSTNGTRVNKRKLAPHEVVEVRDKDLIVISDEEFVFHIN